MVEMEQRRRAGDNELGGSRKGEKRRKKYVWFGSGRWASNSGHRARMTSNRSRALCQHSAPNRPVTLILCFIDAVADADDPDDLCNRWERSGLASVDNGMGKWVAVDIVGQ